MNQLATITSKKQLTLPSGIFQKAQLKEGQKVLVTEENGRIIITPSEKLIEDLADSITPPKKWEGKTPDQIIEESKKEYFRANI